MKRSSKVFVILLLVLLVVLLVPVPHYNKYDALCLPCPPTDDCPPCPRKGWEFRKPILLQLASRLKPQQVSDELGETQSPKNGKLGGEAGEKQALLEQVESECGKKLDGYTKMLIRERSFNDFVVVFVHSKTKPISYQVAALERLGVVVNLESWIPPFEGYQTGFFPASIPIKKVPDVCGLRFIERMNSAEEEHHPQTGGASPGF